MSVQQQFVRKHGDEQFLTKAKKKKCEFSTCLNDTEDALIKCNVCGLWVCELCNDIPISKLKPLMNKCSGVYFACVTCRESNITTDSKTEKVSELTKQVSTLQAKEQSLREQLVNVNKNNGDLRGKIEDLESEDEKTQNKLKAQGKMIQLARKKLEEHEADFLAQQTKFEEAGNPNFDNIVKLEQCMKKELEAIGNSIKESLVKEIHENNERLERKLNIANPSKPSDVQNADNEEGENLTTCAWNVRAPVQDFRAILKETQTEQLNEANDQKIRARNLIIHGVQEDSDAEATVRKSKDQNFIGSFLQTIGLNDISYKTVIRIGKAIPDKKRPIMLVLNSEFDKDRILKSLTSLKDQADFKGISITEDYTVAERTMLKEWRDKAKMKNDKEEAESNYIWRVRGTPKNGLMLKRFTRQKTAPGM